MQKKVRILQQGKEIGIEIKIKKANRKELGREKN
jgi:hypothetical protein